MFEGLSLESDERRVNAPVVKVEASPEVTAIVRQAWAKQQESGEKALGHSVAVGADNVVEFHAQARSACNAHEPKLKYRKLSRVGKSKDPAKAYFFVELWPEKDDSEDASDTAENEEAEGTPEAKPTTRRRAAK